MPDGEIYASGKDVRIRQSCGAPAPLVANGGGYVGCTLDKGHDGAHKVDVQWSADKRWPPEVETK